jgi:hypothetical protein
LMRSRRWGLSYRPGGGEALKLPNVDLAEVASRKLRDYQLSPTHRAGHHKAAFFERYGFSAEAWTVLRDALIRHASQHEIVRREASSFGFRYVVEGTLESPDGRNPRVRSVWFIETNGRHPRFVTAYPLRRERP